MDDDPSFSLTDRFRSCLDTCLPCFPSLSRPSSSDDYFLEDSISHHHHLLSSSPAESEHGREHEYDHHQSTELSTRPHSSQSQPSHVSRWDLLVSWISTQLCLNITRRSDLLQIDQDHQQYTTSLSLTDADALILDDISIAINSRLKRQSIQSFNSKQSTSHQSDQLKSVSSKKKPQEPSPDLSHHSKHRGSKHGPSQATHLSISTRGLENHKHGKRSKSSKSKSKKCSSSSHTEGTDDSEASSLPTLTSRTTTTNPSCSTSSSIGTSKLSVDVIKHIHQAYNQECRALYGRDLSRLQIHQIYNYLISKQSPSTNLSLPMKNSTVKDLEDNFLSQACSQDNFADLDAHQCLINQESLSHSSALATLIEEITKTKSSNNPLLKTVEEVQQEQQANKQNLNTCSSSFPTVSDNSSSDEFDTGSLEEDSPGLMTSSIFELLRI